MENIHEVIENFEEEFYRIKIFKSTTLEKYYCIVQDFRYRLFEYFKNETNFGLSEYFMLLVNKPDRSKYNYNIFLKYLESLERVNSMCISLENTYNKLNNIDN